MRESDFLDRTWARNEKTASDEHERSLCTTETGYDEQQGGRDYTEEAFRIIAGKGSENGYKAALLDVYRGYNTSTPIVIAGAGGEGRLWKR